MSEPRACAITWDERRLRTPAQFAAVAAARGARAPRGARRWLAVSCRIDDAAAAGQARSRFGLTVPRRLARRAVDRNLVKRVVREAMRAAATALDQAAAAPRGDSRIDIVVRLKAPLAPIAELPRARLKSELRAEADALLAALVRDVRAALATERRP